VRLAETAMEACRILPRRMALASDDALCVCARRQSILADISPGYTLLSVRHL
jgi:hypothetical protein